MINIIRKIIRDPNNNNSTIELFFIDQNVENLCISFLKDQFSRSIETLNSVGIADRDVVVITSVDEFKDMYNERCKSHALNRLTKYEKEILFPQNKVK